MKKESKPCHDEKGWFNARPVTDRPGEWVIQWNTAERELPPGEYPGPWHIEHMPTGCAAWCPDRGTADTGLLDAAKGPGKSTGSVAKGLWQQVAGFRTQRAAGAAVAAAVDAAAAQPTDRPPTAPTRQKAGEVANGDIQSAGERLTTIIKEVDGRLFGGESTPARESPRGALSEILARISDELVSAAIAEGLVATRSFVVGSGETQYVETVPDIPTRLKAADMWICHNCGRPIERQQIIHAGRPSKPGDFLEFLNSSREARSTIRAILDHHEKEDA